MQIKAVFHIDELEKWKILISNIKNLKKSISDSPYEIEIVANSVAVNAYRKDTSSFTIELNELFSFGIKICACRNALNGLSIHDDELFDFIEIVPVGVKEIIVKQLLGFAYVKP